MTIGNHRFLSLFPAALATRLAREIVVSDYADGTVIFKEGARSDSLFLVDSGQIVLSKRANDRQTQVIVRKGAGEYFGELGALDGSKRSTAAVTEGPARLGRLSRTAFHAVLADASWTTLRRLFAELNANLRNSNDRFVSEIIRKEKLTLVGEMANAMIHDFRGPFSSIQLAIELLANKNPDEASQRYCNIILRQLGRLGGMVEEVLEFSRGETKLNLQPVHLPDLFHHFADGNLETFTRAGVKLVLKPAELTLPLDADRFERVLQNLANNAREALTGRPRARVTITAVRQAGRCVITVADNGPGLPPQIRTNLFQPFQTHGKKNGTGLGLAIVKSVVEHHHGAISCRSTRAGTTFTIRLPLS